MFRRELDDNLLLTSLCNNDAAELFALVKANRNHLRQWLPWLDKNNQVEDTQNFITSTIKQASQNLGFVCAIRHKNIIVGIAGYHPINVNDRSVVIGYWLAENATGKGIMTKCCSVLVDYAFEKFDLMRIDIPVAVDNFKSRAIPERLGFLKNGTIQNAEWLYDHYVDHVKYELTKEQWEQRQHIKG